MTDDLSDEGLVNAYGDILLELPELFEALRRFALKNRQFPAGQSVRLRHGASAIVVPSSVIASAPI